MKQTVKIALGVGGGTLVLATAGLAVAMAGPDGNDVTGPAADKARAAATQAVPGGKVGEVEQETGEGAVVYGVAVTKPDGSQVEVHLDKDFHVLGTMPPGHDNDDH